MIRSLFTSGDIAAMMKLLDAIPARASGPLRWRALLVGITELVNCDAADVSSWRRSAQRWSRMSRVSYDPQHLRPAPSRIPTAEQSALAAPDGAEVRTWSLESSSDWGGPALLSLRTTSETAFLLALRRMPGRASFTRRPVTMIDALVRCDQFFGDEPTAASNRRTEPLPCRLEEVLDGILSGHSEKQIAANLGISVNTVHVHVKSLHKRFRVTSRGELMSLWIRHPTAAVDPPKHDGARTFVEALG